MRTFLSEATDFCSVNYQFPCSNSVLAYLPFHETIMIIPTIGFLGTIIRPRPVKQYFVSVIFLFLISHFKDLSMCLSLMKQILANFAFLKNGII